MFDVECSMFSLSIISMSDPISQARALLAAARSPVVFTGAGVSADSGVPTFRGVAGASDDTFWGKYDPMQLATPRGFRDDPKLVYDRSEERRVGEEWRHREEPDV